MGTYSWQRPAKYASEQDREKLKEWMTRDYPRIVARQSGKGRDSLGRRNRSRALNVSCASTRPRGQTPALRLPVKRARISMISSITNRGDIQFMLYEKGLRVATFLTFLKRLVAHRKRKLFLIVDNLQVHHAKRVAAWVEGHRTEVELFPCLPMRSSTIPMSF